MWHMQRKTREGARCSPWRRCYFGSYNPYQRFQVRPLKSRAIPQMLTAQRHINKVSVHRYCANGYVMTEKNGRHRTKRNNVPNHTPPRFNTGAAYPLNQLSVERTFSLNNQPLLTARHQLLRLNCAMEHRHWTVENYRRFTWSNNTHCLLFRSVEYVCKGDSLKIWVHPANRVLCKLVVSLSRCVLLLLDRNTRSCSQTHRPFVFPFVLIDR